MKSTNLPLTLGTVVFASACLSLSVRAQSFTFNDFSSPTGLTLNGSATAPTPDVFAGGVYALQLTPALGGQAGSAFSTTAVQLGNNASFSTAFAFQLSNGGGINDGNSPPNPLGADGLVFVLNTVSNSVGSSGQGVGYQGIGNSVGIKFDTWQDGEGGFPQDNDPNGNFVAIYTDGSTLFDPSAVPGSGPANAYYTPSTPMKNGDIWYAWVDFNGATDSLSVSLSDGVDVRPINPVLTETIDLNAASILGSSPNVYAGFTSGTGGAWDQTDVLNWQFNDTYQPITQVGNSVPDSGPGLPLIAGILVAMGAFASMRNRRATQSV